MRVFTAPTEVSAAVGVPLGHSGWRVVEQAQVDAFAEATGDRQWIHVDLARAAAGPFGRPIAHGYLVLGLLPALTAEIYRVEGARLAVNYGLDRVRFPAPLPAGSAVRAGAVLHSVDEVPGGLHVVTEVTVERRGGDKPCCVARTVTRLYL
ncbi:MAG TPA: MaoC family dehydratase [Pilimelia sp.]|nr:MaoC family dehydratase [Pilimelia sp.]